MKDKEDLKINVSDSITMTDKVSYSTHLSPEIYREEFEKYRKQINAGDGGKAYALAYILLHIYYENHTHYFLHFLIGGGFSTPAVQCWKEKHKVEQKLDCFQSILDTHNFTYSHQLFSDIKTNYFKLKDIRNLLAHGHPVTASYDSETVTISDAKAYLDPQQFNTIIGHANQAIAAWDALMDEVKQQKTLLKTAGMPEPNFFEDCKFSSSL
ncbi:MAG: hypothetical protein WDZ75_02275 [Candidatus Paceibacterota bacterium]